MVRTSRTMVKKNTCLYNHPSLFGDILGKASCLYSCGNYEIYSWFLWHFSLQKVELNTFPLEWAVDLFVMKDSGGNDGVWLPKRPGHKGHHGFLLLFLLLDHSPRGNHFKLRHENIQEALWRDPYGKDPRKVGMAFYKWK